MIPPTFWLLYAVATIADAFLVGWLCRSRSPVAQLGVESGALFGTILLSAVVIEAVLDRRLRPRAADQAWSLVTQMFGNY